MHKKCTKFCYAGDMDSRRRRVLNGWRFLDRTDFIGIGAILAVAAACAVRALWDPEMWVAAGAWVVFAVVMYLILGVAIGQRRRPELSQVGAEAKIAAQALREWHPPTKFDAQWHYQSADYWLRVAGRPGKSIQATNAAAGLAQAHASLALAALQILRTPKAGPGGLNPLIIKRPDSSAS